MVDGSSLEHILIGYYLRNLHSCVRLCEFVYFERQSQPQSFQVENFKQQIIQISFHVGFTHSHERRRCRAFTFHVSSMTNYNDSSEVACSAIVEGMGTACVLAWSPGCIGSSVMYCQYNFFAAADWQTTRDKLYSPVKHYAWVDLQSSFNCHIAASWIYFERNFSFSTSIRNITNKIVEGKEALIPLLQNSFTVTIIIHNNFTRLFTLDSYAINKW